MRKTDNYEDEMKKFSSSLYRDINKSILSFVLAQTDERTVNILCTASPEDYVKYLAEMLEWSYLCSTLENDSGAFYHLYGENKITSLTQRYSPHHYIYHLAISDSKSDSTLLKLFQVSYYAKHGILIKNHARHF
jgi:phosphoserine phosphatase